MQRKSIQLCVEQRIKYRHQQEVDAYKHDVTGTYTELKSYKRVAYRDPQGIDIQIKWANLEIDDPKFYVEIKQPHATMRFQKGQTSYAPYPTPQGVWELEIVTDEIVFQPGKLELYYYINTQGQVLADYHFRLLY